MDGTGSSEKFHADAKRVVLLDKDIDILRLPARPHNALRRARVNTVREVVDLGEEGVWNIRSVGVRSVDVVFSALARHLGVPRDLIPALRTYEREQADVSQEASSPLELVSSLRDRLAQQHRSHREIVSWLVGVLHRQVSRGHLHRDVTAFGSTIGEWLLEARHGDPVAVCQSLTRITSSSLTVCEELEYLLAGVQPRSTMVLARRYGLHPETLEAIGRDLGLTRERIRQLERKARDQVLASAMRAFHRRDHPNHLSPLLLRLESSLTLGADLEYDITYDAWCARLRENGCLGSWTIPELDALRPSEAVLSIMHLLGKHKPGLLPLPQALDYAFRLAQDGQPDASAGVLRALESTPRPLLRLIDRHRRNSGGVHVGWLSAETGWKEDDLRDVLQSLGYVKLSSHWCSREPQATGGTGGEVFHRALRKAFQYCGPLGLDDLCGALRHSVSRTPFPIVGPDELERVLRSHGYKSEEGLYYWDEPSTETLSQTETVILGCCIEDGPVVHHSYLATSIVEAGLSVSALSATLRSSPLFDRVDQGLYKLRGVTVSLDDVENARTRREKVPVDPEVRYLRSGEIIVRANLGILAVATGTISCDQFPDLRGKWACLVHGKRVGTLRAEPGQLRQVRAPLEALECEVGDRVELIFNTWERTATVSRVKD